MNSADFDLGGHLCLPEMGWKFDFSPAAVCISHSADIWHYTLPWFKDNRCFHVSTAHQSVWDLYPPTQPTPPSGDGGLKSELIAGLLEC